jgi:hypothetical protein
MDGQSGYGETSLLSGRVNNSFHGAGVIGYGD